MLNNNIDHLKVLVKSDKKLFRAILKDCDKNLIICLCECILNCLNGNIKLEPECIERLSKYKTTLRSLIRKHQSIKSKKKLLIQHGQGILPLVLPAVLSALSTLA